VFGVGAAAIVCYETNADSITEGYERAGVLCWRRWPSSRLLMRSRLTTPSVETAASMVTLRACSACAFPASRLPARLWIRPRISPRNRPRIRPRIPNPVIGPTRTELAAWFGSRPRTPTIGVCTGSGTKPGQTWLKYQTGSEWRSTGGVRTAEREWWESPGVGWGAGATGLASRGWRSEDGAAEVGGALDAHDDRESTRWQG
jgi:hypothetical protein